METKFDSNSKAIFVFEEGFEAHPYDFINILSKPEKNMPDYVIFSWKDAEHSHIYNDVPIRYCKYEKISNATLNLCCFPATIPFDFMLDEWDFPGKIVGAIMLIDCRRFFRAELEYYDRVGFYKTEWLHKQNIPTIIVAFNAQRNPDFDRVTMEKQFEQRWNRTFEIPPKTTVIWQDKGYYQKKRSFILDGFNKRFLHSVISKLCTETSI